MWNYGIQRKLPPELSQLVDFTYKKRPTLLWTGRKLSVSACYNTVIKITISMYKTALGCEKHTLSTVYLLPLLCRKIACFRNDKAKFSRITKLSCVPFNMFWFPSSLFEIIFLSDYKSYWFCFFLWTIILFFRIIQPGRDPLKYSGYQATIETGKYSGWWQQWKLKYPDDDQKRTEQSG